MRAYHNPQDRLRLGAKGRVRFAEKDLKQHRKWLAFGEVPEEYAEKARRILEYAKEVAAKAK